MIKRLLEKCSARKLGGGGGGRIVKPGIVQSNPATADASLYKQFSLSPPMQFP